MRSQNYPRLEAFWRWDQLVVYPVPRKTGMILLTPAVVWTIPPCKDLKKYDKQRAVRRGRDSSVGMAIHGTEHTPLCKVFA